MLGYAAGFKRDNPCADSLRRVARRGGTAHWHLGPVRPSVEWTHYGGNAASQKYSPLDQINKDNVGKLTIAWRWSSPDNAVVEANPLSRPGGYADTPLMVKGVLYTVTSLGQIAAINPATGATIWVLDPGNWKTGRPGNLGFVHRGIAYWTRRREGERLLLGTGDAYLISVDAKTGKLDTSVRRGRPRRSDGIARERRARDELFGQRSAGRLQGRRHRRRQHSRRTDEQGMAARRHQRLRRSHRQAAVDDSLHSAEGRVRQRDLGGRFMDLHGQHERVDQHVDRR